VRNSVYPYLYNLIKHLGDDKTVLVSY